MKTDGCGALENKDDAGVSSLHLCVGGDHGVGRANMLKGAIANMWMAPYCLQVLSHPLSH